MFLYLAIARTSDCRDGSPVKSIRYMQGSRAGEVYIEIQGWGSKEEWYAVYELKNKTTEYRIIIDSLKDSP